MSASREKWKRKGERENGSPKNTKTEFSPQLFRNLVTVLCVLAVLAVICVALLGQGLPQQYMTAVAAEGLPVSVAEFDYHYYNSLQSFYSTYSPYFSYFGFDTEKPLYRQKTGEGNETWHDYLVAQTVAAIKEVIRFSELAKSEGVSLTEQDTDAIEITLEAVRNNAVKAGMSEKKYVRELFGRGMTPESLKAAIEREALASRYKKNMNDSFSYSDEQVQAYYGDNKNNYDRVNYRSFSISKQMSDEDYDALAAEGVDLEAEVETPLGTMTEEEKRAYETVAELAEDKDLTPENFNEKAREIAPEDAKENYDDPAYSLTENGTYSEGSRNDWLFAAERKQGDVTVIDDDTQFTVLMFIERIVDDYEAVTIRHIYMTPTSSSSSGNYSDSDWEKAGAEAQAVLDKFAGAGASESDFTALVKENSMDVGTKFSGGLYEEISKDAFGVEELDEWTYDPVRTPGDYTMVKGDSGYHLVYFVGYGRLFTLVQAELTMRQNDFEALHTEKLTDVTEPSKDWLGMNFVAKA